MTSVGIKQIYLDSIRSGNKTLEIRVGDEKIRELEVGDDLRLTSPTDHLIVNIVHIRSYHDIEAMLRRENFSKIIPGKTISEVKRTICAIYPPDRERRGVYVLEVRPNNLASF